MTPGRAEEKEFLAIGHRCVGLANELAEKGMAFKLSLSYGTFIFSMDTTGSTQLPRRRKKCPSAIIRDKRRRMEFLKRKKSTSCPSPPLSLDRLSIERANAVDVDRVQCADEMEKIDRVGEAQREPENVDSDDDYDEELLCEEIHESSRAAQ